MMKVFEMDNENDEKAWGSCPICGEAPEAPPETGDDLMECKNRTCPVHVYSPFTGEIDEDARVVLDHKASTEEVL